MDLELLKSKKLAELREIAAAFGLKTTGLKKGEIIDLLSHPQSEPETAAVAESEKETAIEAVKQPAPARKRGRKSKKQQTAEETAGSAESAEKIADEDGSAATKAETAATPETEAAVAPEEQILASAEEAAPQSAVEEAAPQPKNDNRYETTGILELAEGGFGFLRFHNFLTSDEDVYVSPTQIRRFNLKTGDEIEAVCRKPGADERFGALLFVKTVNGDEPGYARRRKDFSELTPIYPNQRISMEPGNPATAMRLMDLVAPIGKGQRGLIVAPPKAGKTTLLKQIAKAIENQNVDAELIVLLIDERPEEVTDMQESLTKGHVIYSTFDEQPSHHVKVAEMVLARAQRLVEHGKDVIILLDSITRLARAYNLVEPPSGRTLSGGLDPSALYKPKKFFGAARNMREGGSITILATALVETGSRMDDLIFEEFKGTGNMELHLDRNLAEKRVFPAINLNKSGTRREDMLLSPEELEAVWLMRRALADWGPQEATEKIIFDLIQAKTNKQFVEKFRKTRL